MIYNIQEFQNRYFTYQDALHFKYTVAWDKTNNNKIVSGYSGFNSFIEYQDLLNKISKIKNRIFYEIIKNDCKAYFDFDKLYVTELALEHFITEFILYYNKFFSSTITKEDILVYIRDDNEDKNKTQNIKFMIKSVHFIIKGSIVSKQDIKRAIEYFKMIIDNKLVKQLDDKIYTSNRQFNLYNNTKLKYIQENNSNPKYFIDFKDQSKNPKHYLASYTEGLPNLRPSRYTLLALSLVKQTLQKNTFQLKNAFNKMKLGIPEQEPRQQININEPIEIFDYLLFNLPSSFYTNTNDWKQITVLFKKFGLSNEDFNKWNNHSILTTNWDKNQNETYYNQLDISKCKSGRKVFKQIIERHIRIEIIYNTNVKLCHWLFEKTKINNEIIDSILLNQKGVDIICIENYSYSCSTGFLKNDLEIIGNYFIEVELKQLANEAKLENVITLDKIEDISPFIEQFNTNINKSVLAVKAKWGSGKTHFIIRNIIGYANANKIRAVVLTENNSLNKQIVTQFSSETNKFISHINKSKYDLNTNNLFDETELTNIVCSTESIQKIKFRDTDILILDEFESILNHYESETFNEQQFKKFVLFKQALQVVNKVVLLDADLSNERISLISKITQVKIQPIHITTNNFNDYTFNVFTKEDILRRNCLTDLQNNQKIIYASSSKNYLNILYKELIKKFPDKIIVKLNAEGIENNIEAQISKSNFLENLETFIIEKKVDVFLYTPSIKTGISINNEYFDVCYAYGHNKSVCCREFIQMLFRARLLKNKVINIAMNTNIIKPRPYVSTSQIKNYLINPVYLLQTFQLFQDNADLSNKTIDYSTFIKFDEDYLLLKILNLYENYNSQTRYTQDFLTRMIYNHNIDVKYIDYVEANEEIAEDIENIEDECISKFVNCRLVSPSEFITDNTLNWIEREKYKLFYQTYFIKGITDTNTINYDIYNYVNNDLFYKAYTNKSISSKYKLLKSILDKNIENLQADFTNEINIHKETNNEFTNYEHMKGKQIIITKLLNEMGLDLNIFPLKLKNAEFDTKVKNFNFTGFQNELKQYYQNFKIEHTFIFDFQNKEYVKNMKRIVCDLLANIDITIKYVNNKHTTRPNDTMIFSFGDFMNNNKHYKGRLTSTDTRVKDCQIRRTKNTFTYNDKKAYATHNPLFFTTYKTSINKAIKSIMNTTIYDDTVIETNRVNVIIQLAKHVKQLIKPILITQANYTKVINGIYDEVDEEE